MGDKLHHPNRIDETPKTLYFQLADGPKSGYRFQTITKVSTVVLTPALPGRETNFYWVLSTDGKLP